MRDGASHARAGRALSDTHGSRSVISLRRKLVPIQKAPAGSRDTTPDGSTDGSRDFEVWSRLSVEPSVNRSRERPTSNVTLHDHKRELGGGSREAGRFRARAHRGQFLVVHTYMAKVYAHKWRRAFGEHSLLLLLPGGGGGGGGWRRLGGARGRTHWAPSRALCWHALHAP